MFRQDNKIPSQQNIPHGFKGNETRKHDPIHSQTDLNELNIQNAYQLLHILISESLVRFISRIKDAKNCSKGFIKIIILRYKATEQGHDHSNINRNVCADELIYLRHLDL